jgi:putative MATE family efflux protein
VDDHPLIEAPSSAEVTLEPAPLTVALPHGNRLIDHSLSTWQLVLLLAWPVLVQQWLVLSVPLVDSYLAGAVLTTDPVSQIATQAAQTTANYLSWLVASCTVIISAGSTALVARFTGAGDRAAAIHATNQSIMLSFVVGLIVSAGGLFGLPSLLTLLNVHGETAALTIAYMRPLFLLLVFPMVTCGGIACLIGVGDTRTGLYIYGGVALLNVPLAWLFFRGAGPLPGLGFVGIACGTALSHVLGCLVVVALLIRGRAGLRLHWRLLVPDGHLLYRLLRVSVPAAIDSLSNAAAQLWFLSIVNQLSTAESAAHGIALRWEALSYQSGAAFGVAAMTLVGQHLGARQPARAARSGWTAYLLGGGVMTAFGVVFLILAPQMFRLFCPHPDQQPIVEAGVPVLRLVAFTMPALASTMIFTAALRGAGDTRVPVLFTWFGFLLIRIPLAYLLTCEHIALGSWGTWPGPHLGLFGAWLAMAADLFVRGGFFVARFAGGRWQSIRV